MEIGGPFDVGLQDLGVGIIGKKCKYVDTVYMHKQNHEKNEVHDV